MRGKSGNHDALTSVVRDESGTAIVFTLVTMALLTAVGAAALNSSAIETMMSGNQRRSLASFHAAEAGIQHGKEYLRVNAASDTDFVAELQAADGSDTVLSDSTNRTSFSGSDDVPLISTTPVDTGTYPRYTVYVTNDDVDGVTVSGTDTNTTVTLTARGEGSENSTAYLQLVVTRPTGPQINAPLYARNNVTGNGSSMAVNGNDGCGATAAVPPIYTLDPATTSLSGSPSMSGDPPTPVAGSNAVDIQAYVNAMKGSVDTTVTTDVNGGTDPYLGTSSDHQVIYSNTSSPNNVNGLQIQSRTGFGILLVEGDLTLGGGFTWNGLILVTGTLTFNGGGAGVNIVGAVLAEQTVDLNGGIDVGFNSCAIAEAMTGVPLTVMGWKQL